MLQPTYVKIVPDNLFNAADTLVDAMVLEGVYFRGNHGLKLHISAFHLIYQLQKYTNLESVFYFPFNNEMYLGKRVEL